jgi:hypothetical protein
MTESTLRPPTATAWQVYYKALDAITSGAIHLDHDTLMVALFTHESNARTRLGATLFGELTHELPTGNGYTAGGQLLPHLVRMEANGDKAIVTGNPRWYAKDDDLTAKFAVVYRKSGDYGQTDALVCVTEFLATDAGMTTPRGQDLSIICHPTGLFTITYHD